MLIFHDDKILLINVSVYEYDDNGNRLSFAKPNETTYGTYDDQDRMLTYGDANYNYTTNGSLRYKAVDNDTTFYTYDFMGNLIAVKIPNGNVVEYLIDAQNRRVGKKLNGVLEKRWIYQDQLNPVAELDGNGNLISRFIYGDKGHVPSYMVKNDSTYRIISDHLGSVRLVINVASGYIAQYITYDEFGSVLSHSNLDFQPFGYAGGLFDKHTEFYRFGLRDYDMAIGRWTSRDLIRFDSGDLNHYLYCQNNPINFIDPSGLLFFGLIDAGENWGQEAAEYYASILADPCSEGWEKALAWIGGLFASLWTPDTSDATFLTLVAAKLVALRLAGWSFKIAIHSAHHTFGNLGKMKHIQIIIWKAGEEASHHILRIPLGR